jgi:hypothetical protein
LGALSKYRFVHLAVNKNVLHSCELTLGVAALEVHATSTEVVSQSLVDNYPGAR